MLDHVKVIDWYPPESSTVTISEELICGGGCAFNVIVNLAKFDPEIPLVGLGLVGEDRDGEFIVQECARHPSIDTSQLLSVPAGRTSYTDVFNVRSTGARTFFHFRGVSSLFSPEHVRLDRLDTAMFHFGYLLTMDAMDASDPEFGTVAARFLCDLQTRGIRTSIDLVSEDSHRFEKIVPPSLPYVNYCIINDFEAEKLSGVNLRREGRLIEGNLRRSAELILDLGVRDLVVIHFPEGAYLLTHDGRAAIQPSLDLPNDVVVCAVGAGDSFCAGVLYGIHQEWSLTDTLQFAVCAGARNLLDLSTTGAIIRWREILKMKNTYRFRRGIT